MKKSELNYEVAKAVGGIDEKYIEKNYGKRGRKVSKHMLILVAIVGILSAGAITGAMYYKIVENRTLEAFSQRWGYSEEQVEIIQEIGREVGVSVTDNGITMTVDAILGDETTAIVVYSITYEDGSPFILPPLGKGEYYRFGPAYNDVGQYTTGTELTILADGGYFWESGGGYMRCDFVDVDPSDGSVQVIETLEFNKLPVGHQVFSTFADISVYKVDYDWLGQVVSSEMTLIHEGMWRMEYPFDYGDTGIVLAENESFVFEEKNIHVEQIWMSPFSIRVEVSCDKNEMRLHDSFSEIPFYYTTTKGKKVDLNKVEEGATFGGGTSSEVLKVHSVGTYHFKEITFYDQIASVTFGDITVEVG